MINATIWNSNQLLTVCNAEHTQDNTMIAQTIIRMYMTAKNFFQEDMIECMNEFINNQSLNFPKYNLKF